MAIEHHFEEINGLRYHFVTGGKLMVRTGGCSTTGQPPVRTRQRTSPNAA